MMSLESARLSLPWPAEAVAVQNSVLTDRGRISGVGVNLSHQLNNLSTSPTARTVVYMDLSKVIHLVPSPL